ncbi:FAD-binding oxidoreductase [Nocardiopsis dassonvillei]|uniref:FAD-binding oxidoreductase n=1 Tax=Nocardiopsis dassonvillei TaxID=2014 RepID=UPI0008FC5E15|nr:FAD-binding oxidoreductase [Nocardiopsis dassonvillei]APC34458.1 FAD-binding oxidoreductase [Nocardiopsis dassonvillei]
MTLVEGPNARDGALREGTDADAVGGLVPARVARPADTRGLARVMASAAREGLTVVARGGGTALDWGGLPRGLDLLVDTADLSWTEHIAGDLVVEVGAGTPVAELYDVLAAAGQRLSADPVRVGGTVGGMVATGVSGPRRLLTGALRDLVIGMTVVRADGVVARSGGRVVKNVAGYDLAKLHTSGLGTLGVIASVAFRLHPLPRALRVLTLPASHAEHAERLLTALRGCTATPAAVELDWPSASLRVVLEGTPDGLGARTAEIAAAAGAEPDVADALPEGWGVLPAEGTLALVSVPPAESVRAAVRVHELSGAGVTGSARAGALYASFPPGTGAAEVAAALDGVRSVPGWTMTLLRAEPHVHAAGVDLWGEVPGLPLMRAVKDSLDPGHRLAPGRFAGGI